MKRRLFLRSTSLLGLLGSTTLLRSQELISKASDPNDFTALNNIANDRDYWVSLLKKISDPILSNMSKGELRKNIKMSYSPTWDGRNNEVAYMEAFGRLIAGIAPFVALGPDNTAEGKIRGELGEQIRNSLAHAVNPQSPDYLYWGSPTSRQPLVDAAYIAQALLAAPKTLWEPLSDITKQQVIKEFKGLRQITPYNNNWVLFAAMVESFLLSIGEEIDAKRIDEAITTIEKWYVGDGWYKDGEKFHFDHYNGYVIHPMLIEVLKANVAAGRKSEEEFKIAYKRMKRYGWFQERYISPEGYYPIIGRSSTYRAGAFQPLGKLALDQQLPDGISPSQVRAGLTAVLKNLFVPGTFTKEGLLTIGLVGDQQAKIADYYSNTGSMYLTSLVFLPLGLPATNEFWSSPASSWTQKKAWNGEPFPKDYAVDY